MLKWIIGGAVLLVGAIGNALSGSDSSGASSIGRSMEKLSNSAKDKIYEAGEARENASCMSDDELKRAAHSSNTLKKAAAMAEYKSRHSDD